MVSGVYYKLVNYRGYTKTINHGGSELRGCTVVSTNM